MKFISLLHKDQGKNESHNNGVWYFPPISQSVSPFYVPSEKTNHIRHILFAVSGSVSSSEIVIFFIYWKTLSEMWSTLSEEITLKPIFLMGIANPKINLNAEIHRHNDMLIGNFEEHPMNNSIKVRVCQNIFWLFIWSLVILYRIEFWFCSLYGMR